MKSDSGAVYLYADDAKIYKTFTTTDDEECLQKALDKMKDWCDNWLLKMNINKCKVISYGIKNVVETADYIKDDNVKYELEKVDSISDLGVIFDSTLSFRDHIQQKINKAYSIIGIIKRNFIHMDAKTFTLLYKTLVRPHVEYANTVWSPYKKGDITEIEKVQKRATKLVINLKKIVLYRSLKKVTSSYSEIQTTERGHD